MTHYGWLSLLPTVAVLIIAFWSRKTFEALLGGTLLGFLLLDGLGFFASFTTQLLQTMADPTIGWIILVCGLFGSLIHLLVRSGGASAFASWLLRHVHNRRSALLVTWLLGLCIFIDDYLNALTVGNSMKKVTDKFGVPREMLAYIVDSTAAPICVLVPLSTWAIYVGGLLESEGVAAAGQGLTAYLKAIPYIIYGWVAALIVPLVALRIIPPLGAMKAAEARANSGQLIPPDSTAITLHLPETTTEQPYTFYFVLPILVLITATVWFEIDALKGVLTALAFTIVYYRVSRIMNLSQAMDSVFEGFKTMLYALAIIILSFMLKAVNEQLDLTTYIIEGVSPWMSRAFLPAITFLALALVTFATGSFWGVYAITLPIIIPLAQSLEVNLWLAVGAVLSAGAFGSHACFYGDATVLSSSATGCNNMAHVLTQLPYVLMAGAIAIVGYLILGYMAI
ncbi:MAG: sodium:proton antiporter [Bacteroidetes bacterium]|nr:MAG: sodium:proton antiporter [Bacteroidota bacterium]